MKVFDIITGEISEARFPTNYRHPLDAHSEVPGRGTITEMSYIPPQVQIADFMNAGIRLNAERKARFDTVELNLENGQDPPLDPMREPNVDIVDVQRAGNAAQERIAAVRAAQDKAVEESRRAEDARIAAAAAAAQAANTPK